MARLNITLQGASSHNITLQGASSKDISLVAPSAGTSDYERLRNKPSINGVPLVGDVTSVDLGIVSENTESGWSETPMYVPKRGEICLYLDTNKIKIGDGIVPIVDLPYVNEGDFDTIWDALHDHTNDASIHVTQQEKDFWNAKLNYDVAGEELTFTRN